MQFSVYGVLCFATFASSYTVKRKSFAGENFCKFHGFGPIYESFNRENLHWVQWCDYQWVCHCHFPQFVTVLIIKIWLSAILESFHPRKIPAIRYRISLIKHRIWVNAGSLLIAVFFTAQQEISTRFQINARVPNGRASHTAHMWSLVCLIAKFVSSDQLVKRVLVDVSRAIVVWSVRWRKISLPPF